jgi:hypothetical protein
VLLLGTVALLLLLHRGDAEGAARLAHREIEFLLHRGETVEERVPVAQRHWWNWFRVTHGVLAATDRRLLYVGAPPQALLRHEEEPAELEEASWRYEQPIEVQRERMFFGTLEGLVLSTDSVRERFAVAAHDVARLDTVLAVITRRREEMRAVQDAERRALEVAAEAARRPISHLTREGESLERIAARYGTSIDSLRAWNALANDRIKVGQRLLVKPGR